MVISSRARFDIKEEEGGQKRYYKYPPKTPVVSRKNPYLSGRFADHCDRACRAFPDIEL